MKKMNIMDWIVMILVIVGGLNWGLVGIFKYDLVAHIFGNDTTAMGARIIYTLVGLSALWMLIKSLMMGGGKSTAPAAPMAPKM